MRPDDVRIYLNRQPFRPFRIYLSSRVYYDIRHPHMAQLGRSTVTIGLSVEGDMQRFIVVALVHIVWLEVLLPVP